MPEKTQAWRRRGGVSCLFVVLITVVAALLYDRLVGTAATTVLVVCDAETQSAPAEDPPLSVAGLERARELARLTADLDLTALYASQLQRTLQTAQPMALRTGLPITPIPDDPAALARAIDDRHRGGTIAVVSRCDDATGIVETLTAASPRTMPPAAADTLSIITLYHHGQAASLRLKYGEPILP